MQSLEANLQSLSMDTKKTSGKELAELQELIATSNSQATDIMKLYSSNAMWQQNFRVINSTFNKLRKVVVFPIPSLSSPTVTAAAVRRILPATEHKKNITIVKTSQ